ncbi:hypothetical protein ACF0H5_018645 [Mactra antiquata]
MPKLYLVALMMVLSGISFGLGQAIGVSYNEMSLDTPAKIKEIENTLEDMKLQLKLLTQERSLPTQKRKSNTIEIPRNNGIYLGSTVAFYAKLKYDSTLSIGKTLVFPVVQTNIGDAYDRRTGVFTAPVDGTYVFSLVIACEAGNYLEVSIVTGQYDMVYNSICKNPESNGVHQNGGSAIVTLKRGDRITVKMMWPSGNDTVAVGRGFSSFSGFLVQ